MPSAVWKGRLTFGLVSIPIRIIRAARQERIAFRRVQRTDPAPAEAVAPAFQYEEEADAPITFNVAPVHQAPAERAAEPLKGFEYEKGRFAVFHEREIKRMKVATSRDMEILQFVKFEEIDPVFMNVSYYVAPDLGGEKPYAVLFEAMRKAEQAAIAHVSMHGRRQFLALRSGANGIAMHTLFFANEVHEADEFHADTELVTPRELQFAELLIAQLEEKFDASQFRDERIERMREAVAQRIAAQTEASRPQRKQPAAAKNAGRRRAAS